MRSEPLNCRDKEKGNLRTMEYPSLYPSILNGQYESLQRILLNFLVLPYKGRINVVGTIRYVVQFHIESGEDNKSCHSRGDLITNSPQKVR